MTDNALKRRLRAGETLYGCWLSLGAPLAADATWLLQGATAALAQARG